ncbi:MAG: TadE/TadG family type IV pilus assembly protein [Candidatus Limnocylindria bacterium]
MIRVDEARGQSLVEFALILPVLILILVGIFDGGRLVFANHTVNNAAREGGREAIVNQTEADIQARAAQHAVALDIDPANVYVDFRCASTVTCPLTPDDADSCDFAIGTQEIVTCLAVVQVRYQYIAATPIIGALIGPMWVTGEVRFPVGFNCVGAGCPLGN